MATIFMKYGAVVKGSATAESGDPAANYGKDGWIDLTSLSYNVERAVAQGAASSTNREASAPQISEFSIAKDLDKSSPLLFKESVLGKPVEVILHLCSPQTDGKMLWWAQFKLQNAIIQNYTVKGDAEGTPSEDIQVRFTKVNFVFKIMDEKGQAKQQIPFGYDLAKNMME